MFRLLPALAASALFGVIASGSTASGQSNTPSDNARHQQLTDTDKQFLNYAAEDNQAEIQLCLLAEKKAKNLAVKAFARLMVDDHVEIESRLAALANGETMQLPNGIGKEGEETQSKLEPLMGEKFDSEFLQAQIKDHSDDVKKFSNEESQTQNEGVKRFAAETLPILQQHWQLAKAVQSGL